MRDGRELAQALRDMGPHAEPQRPELLGRIVRPYLQFVDATSRCSESGLKLQDIWRYFRHTWANHYGSVPGRNLLILVRDSAARFHPVIGIAALGSSVVQSAVRDQWIGWDPEAVVQRLSEGSTEHDAKWIARLLQQSLSSIYIEDLLEDAITPAELKNPKPATITRLDRLAETARERHKQNVDPAKHKSQGVKNDQYWINEARSDLFLAKRAALLALLFRSVSVLGPGFARSPSATALQSALSTWEGRRCITSLVRRKKAEMVGVSIADITVCGAIPPYSHLLGGKLIAMLLASPEVIRAYRERYENQDSVIASSLAGRSVRRPTHLASLSTTSLYGVVPNQYTRVSVPVLEADRRPSNAVRYRRLGVTAGFGSFHIGDDTRQALARLTTGGVNYVFGEGVSPRLRALRAGVDELGLPSDQVLMHGSAKVVYGVALASNMRQYLLGLDDEPEYLLDGAAPEKATQAIGDWWIRRWLCKRVENEDAIRRVEAESLVYPIRHGARVPLPPDEDNVQPMLPLFED